MTYFVKCQYNSPRLFKIYLHKKYVDICTWSYISLDAPDARVEHSCMYILSGVRRDHSSVLSEYVPSYLSDEYISWGEGGLINGDSVSKDLK